jgi:hypothetical protein
MFDLGLFFTTYSKIESQNEPAERKNEKEY